MTFNKNNKTYQEWINNKNLDKELKQQLDSYNDEQLSFAFNNELEFGTAGIRGILGAGPGHFNIYTIEAVTISYAKLLIKKYPNDLNRGVVVGHDNRYNSAKFSQRVAQILTSFGIKAYLFKNNDMQPTPVVSYATKKLNAIGGVVITASHNPAQYNGYKIYDEFGCQLMPEDTDVIADEMNKIKDILNYTYKTNESLLKVVNQSVIDDYIKMINDLQFYPNQDKSNYKIVFSGVNGTGNKYTPEILKSQGYDVIIVKEHEQEDPSFKNVGNPNPEFEPAWVYPLQYAKDNNADLVIINDPDADRIGIAVKHNNEWIRLNGNETGPLLIDWKLSNLKRTNKLPKNPALYSSFVTSDLGDRIAHETYGTTIVKTLTGFKWMGSEIKKEPQTGLNFVFAYEESYGYVIDDSTRDKDGIQAAIMIAECGWKYKTQGLDLYEVLENLYKKYGYYYTYTINLNFKPEEVVSKIKPIMEKLRTTKIDHIGDFKVVKVEDYINGLYNMPGQDLMKFYFTDGSWVAIRPSGTEPKLKIYFVVVGTSDTDAKAKEQDLQKALTEMLGI